MSAPHGETLLLLPPRHSKTFKRARGQEGPRGTGSGCEIHSAREDRHHTNCIKRQVLHSEETKTRAQQYKVELRQRLIILKTTYDLVP